MPRRRLLPLAVLAVTLLPPLSARAAGLDTQLSVMFNTLTNATAPTAHLGQRRGVVTGGSVVARNRIMNESLWHLVPPSVKAGCGGIDLFGGSFSFISMEQFQNLLRAIASNAAGYAFEIALQTMCKDCMEVMETLQKKLLALNQGFANSCQLAKGIVNDVADAFDVAHKDKTSLIGTLNGIGDLFEMRSTATGTDTVKAAYDSATDEQKKELTGNLVWQALKRNGVAGFFSGGDNALLEAMMSLTGSVIVGPPVAAPPGGESNYQITPLRGNLLKAYDLLHGSRPAGSVTAGEELHTVSVYRCDTTDEDGCLAPTVSSTVALQGLIQRVRLVLLGNPAAGTVGLVQKFRAGTGGLTDGELAFLQYAPNGLGAGLRLLARFDVGMATLFAEQAAPVIGIELLQTLLNDLLRGVEGATALNRNAYARQMLEQIDSAKQALHGEYQRLSTQYGNVQSLLAYYQGLVEQIKGRRYLTAERVHTAPATQP